MVLRTLQRVATEITQTRTAVISSGVSDTVTDAYESETEWASNHNAAADRTAASSVERGSAVNTHNTLKTTASDNRLATAAQLAAIAPATGTGQATGETGGSAVPRRCKSAARYFFACMIWRISRAVSEGVLPTFTPTASSASCFAAAVPAEPETIAPA